MAFAGAQLYVQVPHDERLDAGVSPSQTAVLLDAASEACGMVVRVAKAGVIKKVLFNTGTVTTGATLDVTIEGVSATTGGPDGTPLTNGTGTCVVDDGDDNVQKTCTFTTGPTVTKGQLIAIRIANPASSAGTLNVNAHSNVRASYYVPYSYTILGGSLSKSRNTPLISLEYDDGSYAYIPGLWPISAFTTETITDSSTPDELGIKFKFPFPVKVAGAWFHAPAGAAANSIKLYDSDGSTALETVSLDPDQYQTTSIGTKLVLFTAEHELDADTFYRLTYLGAASAAGAASGIEVAAAAAMDGWEGGQNIHRTERTDGGAWTDTTTKRPWIGLLLSGFDDGAAGAGGGGGGGQRVIGG